MSEVVKSVGDLDPLVFKVMQWLDDEDSVSQEELKINSATAGNMDTPEVKAAYYAAWTGIKEKCKKYIDEFFDDSNHNQLDYFDAIKEEKAMKAQDLGKMIDWDLIPEKYTQAFILKVNECVCVHYHQSDSVPHETVTVIRRPRKLEDSQLYAITVKSNKLNIVGFYCKDSNVFISQDDRHYEHEVTVCQKLDKSLWDAPK